MPTFGPSFFPPLGPATTQVALEPQGWDRCLLAGKVLPAHARVLQAYCELKRDPKKKKGTDGANPTYNGMDPQPLQLELTTYNDEDREALASILLQYVPKPGRKPESVSIDHPSLRILGIDAVDIIGAGALIPVQGTHVTKMILKLVHSLPAKKGNATTTPKPTPVRKPANVRNGAKKNPLPTETGLISLPPDQLISGG